MADGYDELIAALRKRALGYETSETVFEYDSEGGVVRRKVSVKDVPPDLAAIKLLLEIGGEEEPEDEETLEAEKRRVLGLIEKYYENNGGKNGTR